MYVGVPGSSCKAVVSPRLLQMSYAYQAPFPNVYDFVWLMPCILTRQCVDLWKRRLAACLMGVAQ